jgi:DNA-binding helix-hairpin-helix protein with protein kinase domain
LPAVLECAQRDNGIKAVVLIGVALVAVLMQPGLFWLWLLLAVTGWSLLRNPAVRRDYQRRRLALFAARRELTRLRAEWREQATELPFLSRLQGLQTVRDRYQNLAADLQRQVQRLDADQRQIQLQRFLEGFFVDAAQLPEIRVTDRMALESYGIETAADVTPDALRTVPGFGQRLGRQRTAALLAWRQTLERQFRYDPRQGVDPAAIVDLRQRYAQHRAHLEQELMAGSDELAKLKAAILKRRAQINIALIRQAMLESQAQADLRVFYPGPGELWRRRNRS